MRPKSLWWIADINGVMEPQFSRGLKKSGAYSAIVISNKGVVDTGTWYTKSRLDPASTSNLIQSLQNKYSETCLKRSRKRRLKIGFQDQLLLNAGQKYCRMLQGGAFCNTFDLH